MNLLSVSLRNLRIRALSSTLTTVSIMLGTGLLAALWLLIAEADKRYRSNTAGFDVVIGAKEGAPLTLVLNTVFNYGAAPGVMPLSVYRELHTPRLRQLGTVRYAIPQARGDNYKGFPIIGTTDEMFSRFMRGKDEQDQPRTLRFDRGRPWLFGHDDLLAFAEEKAREKAEGTAASKPADPHAGHDHAGHDHGAEAQHKASPFHEVVIGGGVAGELGLKCGDFVVPVHGVSDDVSAHVHAEDACEVVGILERTGTPIDRAIFLPLRTFLSMEKHDAIRKTSDAEADNLELSAVIVGCASPAGRDRLRYEFQGRRDAQGAVPTVEVVALLKIVGNATDILRVVSYLVIVVAAVSILVSLYNTMNERRREIAIMRSLGARRLQIARIILQEALLISLGGAVLGIVACHFAIRLLAPWIEAQAGVMVDWANFSISELWLILGVGALGGFAGLLPAIKGSLTEVADNLAPTS